MTLKVCWDHGMDSTGTHCRTCGTPYEEMPYCECGQQQQSRFDLFCGQCGRRVMRSLAPEHGRLPWPDRV